MGLVHLYPYPLPLIIQGTEHHTVGWCVDTAAAAVWMTVPKEHCQKCTVYKSFTCIKLHIL